VRVAIIIAALLAGAVAASALAAKAPSYTVSFSGNGVEHHVDTQENIQDSGVCDSAEHVDVTATVAWSTAWPGFRPAPRALLGQPFRIDGSRVEGTDVKDACGLPLDQAPDGWVSQTSCNVALAAGGSPRMTTSVKGTSLILSLTAPQFAVPVGSGCALNVRNDQFAARLTVAGKKLAALKRGATLTLQVGTAHPGPGSAYAPSLDCSQPTKPYLGYRTADHCHDDLSWSGTVKITRAS
jgi:hypothetical protein